MTVHVPSGSLNTHAMLDSGSTCSSILSDTAHKLSLKGPQEQGTSQLNSRRVNTEVSPINMVTLRFKVNGALVVDH